MVSVEIPCEVLPTALYIANFKYSDLVTFKVFNDTKETWRIHLYCEILDYSQKTERVISVPPGMHTETLSVTFHITEISNLKDPVSTQINCQADLILGGVRETLFSETIRVVLLPVDNFIFTRFDPAKKCWIDFTWLITAWVKRRGTLLREIIDRARKIQPQVGRPIPRGEKGRPLIEAQVEAIYRALKEHGLEYHNQVLVFHQADNDYVQRVQFPDETLGGRAANCLDTAVLFASLLSMCDLDPAILLLRGHALVGWKALKNTDDEWRFMETTAISTMTFYDACQVGQKKYQEVQHLCGSTRTDSFAFNPQKFAVLLDVHEVWRKLRILPVSVE
jgi:hypothetical protein